MGEFGGDGAGFDDADPHVLLGEFLAEGFAEDSDGELGGDVDGGPADGLAAGHGADVDQVGADVGGEGIGRAAGQGFKTVRATGHEDQDGAAGGQGAGGGFADAELGMATA